MRILANATFSKSQKSHKARTLCTYSLTKEAVNALFLKNILCFDSVCNNTPASEGWKKTFSSFLDFCTNFPIPSKWLASKRSLFFPARQKKRRFFFLQKSEIDPFSVGSCVTGRGAEWIEKGGYEKMSYKRTGLFIYQNSIDTMEEYLNNIKTTRANDMHIQLVCCSVVG